MRIMWAIHLYPPIHNCGAEYVAHNINKYLLSQGHEVRVLNLQSNTPQYTYDGVEVFGNVKGIDPYRWADVILTHLDFTRFVINIGSVIRTPVIHFVHNSFKYEEVEQGAGKKQYVVYNSNWVRGELNYSHEGVVLYPPCPKQAYQINHDPISNEYITLMNLNENKGGLILLKLAKEMPARKFLAVTGSYDDGGLQPAIIAALKELPNVKVVEHSPDVKSIYAQTRILLVPSRYESWGRVATEAMINGIPVIACPTPGLRENCGEGAIFVNPRGEKTTDIYGDVTSHDGDSYDTSLTKFFIERLDRPDYYNGCSRIALERSDELESIYSVQIAELEKFLHYAKNDYKG
jgi:glycosyltransferase involved in cell wall biosynthesis